MEGFVVDGNYASIHKHPHAVYLNILCDDTSWICGSSILNQWILLTAAHCMDYCNGMEIYARAGHENLWKSKIQRRIINYIRHESYDEDTVECDIAVAKIVKKPLPLGTNVKRVLITSYFQPQLFRARLEVAGWGASDADGNFDDRMKSVPQKLMKANACKTYINLKSSMMCAVYNAGYPSEGDSGSALVTSYHRQLGLVSFRNSDNVNVVVYTNVTYFYWWIATKSKQLYCLN